MRIRKKELGNSNIVGARIEKRRKELGLSQKDLLAKLQVMEIELNSSGLSKIEGQIRGVSDYELVAFSQILDLTLNQLVGLE
ncbi:MAG: helix-turn-helix transcriptional regulator [Clostridia bacterium]|nr:helix-turn-helix transcriptional regulator [Clostridia bacterium]